ncbi:MAG TPA: hypothetical protein VJM31_11150 [Vicinamibacterales bacterium]|nr:hypothetical protein [Vicinamibacterales bacterium]
MTKLERLRTVAAIPAAFRGSGRLAKSLELLEGKAGGTLEFKSTVWKAAKPQLKRESGGKCVYCESKTDTVAHGDVEHFRPKSVYWWLAYCYDNYVYACQICNQVFKGDKFPIHATTGPWTGPTIPAGATAAALATLAETLTPDALDLAAGHAFADFLTTAAQEKAGLVDPYVTDPDPLFKWVADDSLKEVEIRAASNAVAVKRAFAAVTECYGLNRQELKSSRWETRSKLALFIKSLKRFEALGIEPALQQEIRDEIKTMMKADAPYAGMVRFFVSEAQLNL